MIQHIQDKWEVMTTDDCVPIHIALQLLDYSSLGRGNDYYDFKETNKQLQKGLKAIVNEHHQGFNSSIGTFHKIQSSIHTSQSRMRMLKESLMHAKTHLTVAKPELKSLATTSQNYDEMLQILNQIEKIQLLPEQLDGRISDKHFLTAVDVLHDALRLIRKSSLENIGALADLKVYFSNQETSMTDILIEELHDHLYLKSPYTQARWTPYSPDLHGSLESQVNGSSQRIRPLYQFLNSLDTSIPMSDNASQNPEVDSFGYVHMVLESLNKMGRLDVAIDRIEQRLPVELFNIVDRTNHEVEGRHPTHLRAPRNLEKGAFDIHDSGRSKVLDDLLWSLYTKFEAIAEGHRAVHEVVSGIVKREGMRHPEALLRGFKELWKLYQSEIRSLLHDYLATDGDDLYRGGRMSVGNSSIFHRGPRDKSKRVFRLTEMDTKADDVASEQADLDKILQSSVPGLVSKSQSRLSMDKTSRKLVYDSPAASHKLLVEASVFNINILLPPSLMFLQKLKDIVPPASDVALSTLTSFLDDFLVNVFHPQFDETVTELCTQSFMVSDAFHQDSNWSSYARKPIFKGTSVFFLHIRAFCRMLDTVPQDQAFTRMIISQLSSYLEKCRNWYKSVVARASTDGTRLKTAAAMAEGGDMFDIAKAIWQGADSERDSLLQKEIQLITIVTKETPLEPFDIISDRRSVLALCLLYTSMQWLVSQLSNLRHKRPDESVSATQDSAKGRFTRRWTLLNAARAHDENQPLYLPMTKESMKAFDTILTSYHDLAVTALLTLHLDIRCGVIHMLSKTLQSHYLLDQPATEPDGSVLALNADLLSFDDSLTNYLTETEHHFITTGLGGLVDYVLVADASQIKGMNEHGCGRMQLNILVLQQNLKGIEDDVSLARSAQYFEHYSQGADAILSQAKETGGKDFGFNLDEMKILIELCHSEGLQSQQRDVALQARRTLNDHSLQLSESMWDT